jgi:hypothetical protein
MRLVVLGVVILTVHCGAATAPDARELGDAAIDGSVDASFEADMKDASADAPLDAPRVLCPDVNLGSPDATVLCPPGQICGNSGGVPGNFCCFATPGQGDFCES